MNRLLLGTLLVLVVGCAAVPDGSHNGGQPVRLAPPHTIDDLVVLADGTSLSVVYDPDTAASHVLAVGNDGLVVEDYGTAGRSGSFPGRARDLDALGSAVLVTTATSLVMLTSDGVMDASFGGGDGVAPIETGALQQAEATGTSLVDGTLRVAVAGSVGLTPRLDIVSYSLAGDLLGVAPIPAPSTPDGRVVTELGVTWDPAGRPIVSGHAAGDLTVRRLTSSLGPDLAWAAGGLVLFTESYFTDPRPAMLGPDQSVYVYIPVNGMTHSALIAKLTPAGTLDAAYGTGGIAHGPAFALQDDGSGRVFRFADALVDSRGRVAVAGWFEYRGGWSQPGELHPRRAVELRFTPEGQLDGDYGNDGWFQDEAGTGRTDIALHPAGRLLYAGWDAQGTFLVRKIG